MNYETLQANKMILANKIQDKYKDEEIEILETLLQWSSGAQSISLNKQKLIIHPFVFLYYIYYWFI